MWCRLSDNANKSGKLTNFAEPMEPIKGKLTNFAKPMKPIKEKLGTNYEPIKG